jgi:hypothetical protein
MRRFFRASGSRGDDPDVRGDANEGKYHVGERWNYRTRPGEECSLLTVLKVESLPIGVTVHVSVDGLRIENPSAPGGVSESIAHMPFTEEAIDKSATTRAAAEITVTPDDEGYEEWRRASDAGRAGVFTITVAEAVDLMELGLRK